MHEAVLENLGQDLGAHGRDSGAYGRDSGAYGRDSGAYGTRFRILWKKATYRGVLAHCLKIRAIVLQF